MKNSNIIAGSNVFLSHNDDPRHDPAFVSQIQDFARLKGISNRRQVDSLVADFTAPQEKILKTEMRCIYAKNDPCWGYVKSRGKVECACINGDCPNIFKCNPHYSQASSSYWVTSTAEKQLYGDPDKLRWYYIVDMISDEEMGRYTSLPVNTGRNHPVPVNPVPKDKVPKTAPKTRVDPATGKRQFVVGYRWMITDNASYENERLVPIWGSVEELEEEQKPTIFRKKSRRIEKKQVSSTVSQLFNNSTGLTALNADFYNKDEFEKTVTRNITEVVKLTDIEPGLIDNTDTVILLDNPAELAFVSAAFLVNDIKHSLTNTKGVQLALIDDYAQYDNVSYVMVSSTVLKHGCTPDNVTAWKKLAQRKELLKLQISEREYYKFTYAADTSRWTCRNMYGVTHVCIGSKDIQNPAVHADGLYPVSIVSHGDTFKVVKKSGTCIGEASKSFSELIKALIKFGEIPGVPASINGVSIQISRGKTEVLGMGHLKFIEY